MFDGNRVSGIIMVLLLIFIQALIVGAKAALVHMNDSSIRKKAEIGQNSAVRLLQVLNHLNRYLNVLELLQSFTGIVIGMIFISNLLPSLNIILISLGLYQDIQIIKLLCNIIAITLLVFVTVLFGSIIPNRLVSKHAEDYVYWFQGLVRLLGFVFSPLSWLLEKVMNGILLMFGIKPSELMDNVTEEEILSMVNEGQEQGVFNAGEVEMISNIIELGEKEAQDIMTHKKKIVAVNSDLTLEEALHFILSEKYSRYPLYEGNRDNIIGILHLKDVINAYISEDLKIKPLSEIARDPYFVPDTQNINILFHEMQSKNIHMAIVIDEYGQTAGLVALEDFLEEIVGNIQDEYDEEESLILAVLEESVLVKGSISLEELEEKLGIQLDHQDFDTLNGLLISLMDRIPADGEQVTLTFQAYQFEVLETKNNMTQQVRITKLTDTVEGKTTQINEIQFETSV
jgi:putative hemolysin